MVKSLLLMALALAIPGATQPVTVEIVTIGHAAVPAGRYSYGGSLEGEADTRAKAEALLAQRSKLLIQRVGAVGGSVTISPAEFTESTDDGLLNVGDDPMLYNDTMDNFAQSGPTFTGKVTIAIVAPSRAVAGRVRDVVATIDGAVMSDDVETAPADPAAARRIAKADALVSARVEAQVYAAKLRLSDITLVAISEKVDLGALIMMSGPNGSPPFARKSTGDMVPFDVPMTFTFRLDPAAKP